MDTRTPQEKMGRMYRVQRHFYDLTRKEIAEKTANPLGTVHTRARLALQKLRQALAERGIEELDE